MSLKVLMHSFKGGAGRTVSTMNIGYMLAAQHGLRVVVIDLDVESAGASVLFGIEEAIEISPPEEPRALQDILRNASTHSLLFDESFERTWKSVSRPFSDSSQKPQVVLENYLLVPARRILHTTSEPLWADPSVMDDFDTFLARIDSSVDPHVILLDSASGVQQGALLGLMYAQVLVEFARWSKQFLLGTKEFIREQVIGSHGGSPQLRHVVVVPTAVPDGNENLLEKKEKALRESVESLNTLAANRLKRPLQVVIGDSIPESAVLKWDDQIFTRVTNENRRLLATYGSLAERIIGLMNQIEAAND